MALGSLRTLPTISQSLSWEACIAKEQRMRLAAERDAADARPGILEARLAARAATAAAPPPGGGGSGSATGSSCRGGSGGGTARSSSSSCRLRDGPCNNGDHILQRTASVPATPAKAPAEEPAKVGSSMSMTQIASCASPGSGLLPKPNLYAPGSDASGLWPRPQRAVRGEYPQDYIFSQSGGAMGIMLWPSCKSHKTQTAADAAVASATPLSPSTPAASPPSPHPGTPQRSRPPARPRPGARVYIGATKITGGRYLG